MPNASCSPHAPSSAVVAASPTTQYKFGARTGIAPVLLGGMKVVLALLFGSSLLQLLQLFPQPLLGILARHMRNPKASSTADHQLLEALKDFDDPLPVHHFYLHQLQEGDRFITEDGKLFQRGLEQRKRILCKRLTDGRMYLVHPFTEVKRIA